MIRTSSHTRTLIRTWLHMVIATVLGMGAGAITPDHPYIKAALLLGVFATLAKSRLLMLDFLELRHARNWYRLFFSGIVFLLLTVGALRLIF